MGGFWEAGAIEAFIEAAPADCLLLLDEAYLETAPAAAAPPLDLERPNLLRFRTFSKAYGLAGLRVGYVVGAAETVAGFEKIRNHFGVGRLAQAGALAALEDEAGLAENTARIAASRDRIAGIAADNGLSALPSAANFVAIDCGRDGDFARSVLKELSERGRVSSACPGSRRSIAASASAAGRRRRWSRSRPRCRRRCKPPVAG